MHMIRYQAHTSVALPVVNLKRKQTLVKQRTARKNILVHDHIPVFKFQVAQPVTSCQEPSFLAQNYTRTLHGVNNVLDNQGKFPPPTNGLLDFSGRLTQ